MKNLINFKQEAQGARTANTNEVMASNGFNAIYTITATDGQAVEINVSLNDARTSDSLTPLWGVTAAANAYLATPSILLDASSKAEILKYLGTEVYGSEEELIRAFSIATMRLAVHKSFAEWCESNEVDRFAVAQNIVFDGHDMYKKVMDFGVQAVYGDIITYYEVPVFTLS